MPLIYDRWGNFFEQFSLVTGAAIVYARFSSALAPELLDRTGRILLGICAASFTLEQVFYLNATAKLVPKSLPPTQMFWAVTTTVAFALAAVALLTNRMALLAARLLTMMIVIFGLVVWLPLVLSNPHSYANWSETVETFAIAGATWISPISSGSIGLVRRHGRLGRFVNVISELVLAKQRPKPQHFRDDAGSALRCGFPRPECVSI